MDRRGPTRAELDAALDDVRRSPRDAGRIEMIVRRPSAGEREVLDVGEIDVVLGLVGDAWTRRRSSSTADGAPHPGKQLTLMNARVIAAISGQRGDRGRWPLAGDQLYVDLDLGVENLPPGTLISIGAAVIEISVEPHTGCRRFVERFGADALAFVGSEVGRRLRLRGANARVVRGGRVRVGDVARKVATMSSWWLDVTKHRRDTP